jgi:cytochrome c5
MRTLRPTLALAALSAVGALALATAAPGQPAPAPTQPAPSATPAPDAGAPDPGQALVQAKCVMCHDLGPINQGHHTADEWRGVVNEMITNGAAVSPPEEDQIVAYLAKAQPPAAAAPAS